MLHLQTSHPTTRIIDQAGNLTALLAFTSLCRLPTFFSSPEGESLFLLPSPCLSSFNTCSYMQSLSKPRSCFSGCCFIHLLPSGLQSLSPASHKQPSLVGFLFNTCSGGEFEEIAPVTNMNKLSSA